jgi:Domain of unknown function (DUF4124)
MTRLLCFVLAITLPVLAAAQVYRWVDEKGQVHYSQTPPPGRQAQAIVPPPPPAAAPNQDSLNKSLADDRAGAGQRRDEAAKAAQARTDREAQCRQAREQVAFMDANPPVRMTTTDDKGNVARVTEEQHRARRTELQRVADQLCS